MKNSKNTKPLNPLYITILIIFISTACGLSGIGSEESALRGTVAVQSTYISHLSTQVKGLEQVNQSQWDVISYNSTQMPYALGLITPIPPGITLTFTPYPPDDQPIDVTFTPTPSLSIDIEYPPDTRTGIEGIDRVIDAIMSQDIDHKLELVRYTESACTTSDGLGGPPKCESGEADGTKVEAFPVSSGEGHHVRLDDIQKTFDFTVRGLFAVYVVPEDAYQADFWPAGHYGIVFTSEEGGYPHTVTVLVEDGQIVRLDFGFGWPPFETIWSKSDEFILPPMR
jgi:hypothetical protein